MKKYIIIFLFLLMMSSIFAVEIPDITKVKIYNVNLSYGFASGGSIGIGKIQHFDRSTKESTINFHYHMNSDYFATGVYGQINSYRNKQRVGFFTLFAAGVDYTAGKEYRNPIFGIPGGPDEGDYDKVNFEGIFPNIVVGCGYSKKLSQNNRMLIYIDFGFKKIITNLNLAVTF